MNDKELRCMLTVAETGTIQKTAKVLGKNASSISRMIHRLEERLDITLFRRTPSGLVPTPEGEVYLQAAKDIVELYDNLREGRA